MNLVPPSPSQALSDLSNATFHARSATPQSLHEQDLRAWAALEDQALEANAYLSPCFMLPALQHLDPDAGAQIILIERRAAGVTKLAGVAVVCRRQRSDILPLPHWEIYTSRHSYLSAPLIDRQMAHPATACLLKKLARLAPLSAGLVIRNIDHDGPLLATFSEVVQAKGRTLGLIGVQQRAMLVPANAGLDSLKQALRSKYAEMERCRRRLSEQSELQWLIHRETVSSDVIDAFLQLENTGWKREEGTALMSNPADEAFFRDMAHRFATAGRALFTELRLDNKVIASTSNFVSGQVGFAFKVGWDESLRKYGVGILNEAELVRYAPTVCADLSYIDSGSAPNSFIEKLWPQQRRLVTAFVPTSAWGALAWRALQHLRAIRHKRKANQLAAHQESAPGIDNHT